MNDVIHLLPDSVANQIAAGEVVQRPASVIKELVENAVDAGATRIKIVLKDAGRTLIQIVDNGCGMSATDARMAFERHSTSKIRGASDLFALTTMGFRGEALASICAVSRVELRTMRPGDSVGTRLVIEGSRVESQEAEACVPGSNFSVKNLFFNVPARRKFLKSDSVEMGHILREFERMALVNPGVELTLVHNDTVMHQLLPSSFKERIVGLFGNALSRQLVPVGTDTPIVKVEGFVGRPENARRRGALQYFTVNGRCMRHPFFHKAVLSCYEQLIPADEQPNYFISLTVDPATIDVNIHPTKSEIKFEEEQAIWKILVAAVREGLGKFNAMPAIDFDLGGAPDIPVFNPDVEAHHEVELDTSYNPFAMQPAEQKEDVVPSRGERASRLNTATPDRHPRDWEAMYREFERNRRESFEEARHSSLTATLPAGERDATLSGIPGADDVPMASAPSSGVMQLKGRYILSPAKAGLMVIDQHRAHLRVLYDRYLAAAPGPQASQRVIFPERIQLSPAQSETLRGLLPGIAPLGFVLTEPEPGQWEIEALPQTLTGVSQHQLLLELADSPATGHSAEDDLRSRIALAMARAGAVRTGQPLTQGEMEHITSSLLSSPTPGYTPDGLPVLHVITLDELAAMLS